MREGQEGTLLRNEIDFELPYGWLGRIVEKIVRRKLEKLFAYRRKRLLEILGAAMETNCATSVNPNQEAIELVPARSRRGDSLHLRSRCR